MILDGVNGFGVTSVEPLTCFESHDAMYEYL
jgi:hypothetical protein